MRYWELNPDQDEPLFGKIWPTIHREILLAISQLYASNHSESETIAGRAERMVHNALFPTEKLGYSPGSDREASVKRYIDWLLNHTSRRAALTDAFQQDFAIGDRFHERNRVAGLPIAHPIPGPCYQIPHVQNRRAAHTAQGRDPHPSNGSTSEKSRPERYLHPEEPV